MGTKQQAAARLRNKGLQELNRAKQLTAKAEAVVEGFKTKPFEILNFVLGVSAEDIRRMYAEWDSSSREAARNHHQQIVRSGDAPMHQVRKYLEGQSDE